MRYSKGIIINKISEFSESSKRFAQPPSITTTSAINASKSVSSTELSTYHVEENETLSTNVTTSIVTCKEIESIQLSSLHTESSTSTFSTSVSLTSTEQFVQYTPVVTISTNATESPVTTQLETHLTVETSNISVPSLTEEVHMLSKITSVTHGTTESLVLTRVGTNYTVIKESTINVTEPSTSSEVQHTSIKTVPIKNGTEFTVTTALSTGQSTREEEISRNVILPISTEVHVQYTQSKAITTITSGFESSIHINTSTRYPITKEIPLRNMTESSILTEIFTQYTPQTNVSTASSTHYTTVEETLSSNFTKSSAFMEPNLSNKISPTVEGPESSPHTELSTYYSTMKEVPSLNVTESSTSTHGFVQYTPLNATTTINVSESSVSTEGITSVKVLTSNGTEYFVRYTPTTITSSPNTISPGFPEFSAQYTQETTINVTSVPEYSVSTETFFTNTPQKMVTIVNGTLSSTHTETGTKETETVNASSVLSSTAFSAGYTSSSEIPRGNITEATTSSEMVAEYTEMIEETESVSTIHATSSTTNVAEHSVELSTVTELSTGKEEVETMKASTASTSAASLAGYTASGEIPLNTEYTELGKETEPTSLENVKANTTASLAGTSFGTGSEFTELPTPLMIPITINLPTLFDNSSETVIPFEEYYTTTSTTMSTYEEGSSESTFSTNQFRSMGMSDLEMITEYSTNMETEVTILENVGVGSTLFPEEITEYKTNINTEIIEGSTEEEEEEYTEIESAATATELTESSGETSVVSYEGKETEETSIQEQTWSFENVTISTEKLNTTTEFGNESSTSNHLFEMEIAPIEIKQECQEADFKLNKSCMCSIDSLVQDLRKKTLEKDYGKVLAEYKCPKFILEKGGVVVGKKKRRMKRCHSWRNIPNSFITNYTFESAVTAIKLIESSDETTPFSRIKRKNAEDILHPKTWAHTKVTSTAEPANINTAELGDELSLPNRLFEMKVAPIEIKQEWQEGDFKMNKSCLCSVDSLVEDLKDKTLEKDYDKVLAKYKCPKFVLEEGGESVEKKGGKRMKRSYNWKKFTRNVPDSSTMNEYFKDDVHLIDTGI